MDKPQINLNEETGEVTVDKETFDYLKNDEKFISVVNLGRYFNALMSSLMNYLEYKDIETPKGMRQKMAALWTSVGYLHEGLKLFDEIESKFSGDPIYIKTIGKFLSDPEIKEFNKTLANLRSNTSFHFGSKIVKQVLNELNFDKYVLFSFGSDKAGDMYFPISDDVTINYWLKGIKDKEEELKILGEIMTTSSSLILRTSQVLQEFIWEYMNNLIED